MLRIPTKAGLPQEDLRPQKDAVKASCGLFSSTEIHCTVPLLRQQYEHESALNQGTAGIRLNCSHLWLTSSTLIGHTSVTYANKVGPFYPSYPYSVGSGLYCSGSILPSVHAGNVCTGINMHQGKQEESYFPNWMLN